ncbi:MAG: transporter substrate-binding domain-containing protein [Colwellia sp.]|nr:transporter substrate-binding domain-containing protein [Colwellia sp.]
MILKTVLFFCLLFSLSAQSIECNEQQAKKILSDYQWYTEDYPPYNYRNKQEKLVGIFPDTLKLIYEELNINFNDVITVPWARLFYTLETSSKHAAFSMFETPERAKKFQLISLPIVTQVSVMILAENKNILTKKPISELTFAVVRQDIGEHLITNILKATNKVATNSATSMINMLTYQRVEAIAYSSLVVDFQLNRLGITDKKLISIYNFHDNFKTAFIFHKSTPACVTKLFSKTILSLDEKGKLTKIFKQYQY